MTLKLRLPLAAVCLSVLCGFFAGNAAPYVQGGELVPPPLDSTKIGPFSPEKALKSFQLQKGAMIELVASEPSVIDPVSIAFDEHLRMWVVEMTDYPNGPPKDAPPLSRIRLLEDRDQDGKYETATVFADKLLFATGLQPWRGGVIVTFAGEVGYFKDQDGDGKADLRQTWLTGFAQENPQLRANHPRLGLDGCVYVANGLRGGTVTAHSGIWKETPEPFKLGGMDLRFSPDEGKPEPVSGGGQFGLTINPWGERFLCSNRNPCFQVLLDNRDTARNPYQAIPKVVTDVVPADTNSRIFPLTRAWTTSNLHAGQFTAACGVLWYQGDLLPSENHQVFTCDPTGALVHRQELKSAGVAYEPILSDATAEFLASTDEWFRPVDLADGPDGALYVVDMYRAVIEHPDWVPAELKNRPDERWGSDLGRIYKVRSQELPVVKPEPLAGLSTQELVGRLESRSGWVRQTAFRLLLEQKDPASVPLLKQLVKNSTSPEGAVAALWLQQHAQPLSEAEILEGLSRKEPRVRAAALQIIRRTGEGKPLSPGLTAKVIELAKDTAVSARFESALTLGLVDDTDEKAAVLARLLVEGADDPWLVLGALCSTTNLPGRVLQEAAKLVPDQPSETQLALMTQLAELVGTRNEGSEIETVNRVIAEKFEKQSLPTTFAVLRGLNQGAARKSTSAVSLLSKVSQPGASERVREIARSASTIAVDSNAPEELRMDALGIVRLSGEGEHAPAVLKLARDDSSTPLRLAAVHTFSGIADSERIADLLQGFDEAPPSVKRGILQAFLANSDRTKALLKAIEAEQFARSEIDPLTAKQLQESKDQAIAESAKRLFKSPSAEERAKILADYQEVLSLKGDPVNGRNVFEKNCSTCHRIGKIGQNVAPDISDSRDRLPPKLLNDILNPNQAIDNNYVSYTVLTTDGLSHTGIIASESGSSITLKQPEGKSEILLRSDIELIRSNGVSLMPEGLEKNIPMPQMADLISFIKNWRYVEENVPYQK